MKFSLFAALLLSSILTLNTAYAINSIESLATEGTAAPPPSSGETPYLGQETDTASVPPALPEEQEANHITYITGGIGDEEKAAMEAVKSNYNLHILTTDKSGAFAGDTHIAIFNERGEELVKTNADPLFYARLAPGRYVIQASNGSISKEQRVQITGKKQVNIHLTLG